jgi:hypothetical protein
MDILREEDYPAIRAAIDLTLLGGAEVDADEVLANSVIEMSIYGPRAESYVKSKVTDWAVVLAGEDEDTDRLRNAAIFYTAALIYPAIPFYVRESFGDYSYTRSEQDIAKQAAALRGRTEEELGLILDQYAIPTLFTVANGYRGY